MIEQRTKAQANRNWVCFQSLSYFEHSQVSWHKSWRVYCGLVIAAGHGLRRKCHAMFNTSATDPHRSHFDSNIRCGFVQSGFHTLENILQGFFCPCLLICRWRPLLFRSMGILLSFLMKMCRSLSLGQEKYVKTINQAHVLFLRSRLWSFLGFFFSVPSLKKKKRKKKQTFANSAFRNLGLLFTSLYWQNRASYLTYQKLLMTQVMNRTNDLQLIFFIFFILEEGVGREGRLDPTPDLDWWHISTLPCPCRGPLP